MCCVCVCVKSECTLYSTVQSSSCLHVCACCMPAPHRSHSPPSHLPQYVGVGFNHVKRDYMPAPRGTECSSAYNQVCSVYNAYTLISHVEAECLAESAAADQRARLWDKISTGDDFTLAGGFYAFIYDYNGTNVAHGAVAAFRSLALWTIIKHAGLDAFIDGHKLHQAFQKAADAGGGW